MRGWHNTRVLLQHRPQGNAISRSDVWSVRQFVHPTAPSRATTACPANRPNDRPGPGRRSCLSKIHAPVLPIPHIAVDSPQRSVHPIFERLVEFPIPFPLTALRVFPITCVRPVGPPKPRRHNVQMSARPHTSRSNFLCPALRDSRYKPCLQILKSRFAPFLLLYHRLQQSRHLLYWLTRAYVTAPVHQHPQNLR